MIKADEAHECVPTCSPLQERCCDGWPHCLLMTCDAATGARRDQFWRTVAKSGKVYGHPDTVAEWMAKFPRTAQSASSSTIWGALGSIQLISVDALPKGNLYALPPAPSFFPPFKLSDFDLRRSVQVRMAADQEPQREKEQASGLEVESGRGRDGKGAECEEDQGE